MRSKMMLTTLVVFAMVLAGCNTVAGAGKDLQRAGNAITNAAEK
ncbi:MULTISPECIES: entericidin A/B family lipoprotein [Bordetella]|jgi:entericidin B|uniref:Entericidin n=3 Tax=Bordetella TaxID=517 RepID=A0A261REX8_9BORD|nr:MULTISPECIES: entericidin A/B family lipoprotein [Bordetella]ANN66433.1 entericidin [Bordetella bronchialis]ANN71512.1 entericidin [Bordetella bronchialis]AOB30795.1 entericidin [Bordetella sp. H567]ARP81064.1 entericidin [Bordetella genomosp. 8]OZI23584.1 entericidin [Bordetella genomosp. 9]